MKIKTCIFLLAAALVLCVAVLAAQSSERDVILLKNGSIIKGKIIEIIPATSVKIEIAGGSIFIYPMSEVDKITKESFQPTASATVLSQNDANTMPGSSFSIYGGPASTAGNFSKEGGTTWPAWMNAILNSPPLQNPGFPGSGCAREGVIVGVQFTTGGTVGWIINAAYAQNNLSHNPAWNDPSPPPLGTAINIETDKWISMVVLTGIKIGTANSSAVNFFIAPLIGAIYSKSPNITATISNSGNIETIRLVSASGSAVAYGVNVEFTFWGHFILGSRYIYSTPHYDIPYTIAYGAASPTGTISHQQSTSLILSYIGFSF